MRMLPVHTDHPEARELVASDHAIHRYRQRMPVRSPGAAEVIAGLRAALEGADISGWPPGWAVNDRPAALWALHGDLAFPLAPTQIPHRWIAVTCLRRAP